MSMSFLDSEMMITSGLAFSTIPISLELPFLSTEQIFQLTILRLVLMLISGSRMTDYSEVILIFKTRFISFFTYLTISLHLTTWSSFFILVFFF